ncbi:hypothetical protein ACFPFV_00920 [Salinicoccus siamensis]
MISSSGFSSSTAMETTVRHLFPLHRTVRNGLFQPLNNIPYFSR